MPKKALSSKELRALNDRHPPGSRVELISIADPYASLRSGDRGTVVNIDKAGTINVRWDKGSRLGLTYGVDQFKATTAPIYANGREFWEDLRRTRDDLLAARQTASRYLDTQTGRKCPEDSMSFNRELFLAMLEDIAGKPEESHLVYPNSSEVANQKGEITSYQESRQRNIDCSLDIDRTINASCYEPNYYNLELAAMKLITEHGYERVSLILAKAVQDRDTDARFSTAVKAWAGKQSFDSPAFSSSVLNTHPVLIDGLISHLIHMERDHGLRIKQPPERTDSGAVLNGYENNRAVYIEPDASADQSVYENAYALGRWHKEAQAIDSVWREDVRFRRANDGALFYRGNDEGVYVRIDKDGTAYFGRYENASEGIEQAILSTNGKERFGYFEQALVAVFSICGRSFQRDGVK